MTNALSERGVHLRLDEILKQLQARAIVAKFMAQTSLPEQYQKVDLKTLVVENGDGRRRMVLARGELPDLVYCTPLIQASIRAVADSWNYCSER